MYLGFLVTAIGTYLILYKSAFLRSPKRAISNNQEEFLSPANGTIVAVRKFDKTKVVEDKFENEDNIAGAINLFAGDVDTTGTIISIHMKVTDVHFQRCPMSATVRKIEYSKGDFKNAISKTPDGIIRYNNEHCSYLFETPDGIKYKVVQIAGFLARKIQSFINEGQAVVQGEQIGVIKMGSQVTVVLPESIVPIVKVGDIVVDGETVLGKINNL